MAVIDSGPEGFLSDSTLYLFMPSAATLLLCYYTGMALAVTPDHCYMLIPKTGYVHLSTSPQGKSQKCSNMQGSLPRSNREDAQAMTEDDDPKTKPRFPNRCFSSTIKFRTQ